MTEAGDDILDKGCGLYHDEQCMEAANKIVKLLYDLCTSRGKAAYDQLASARDMVLAAALLKEEECEALEAHRAGNVGCASGTGGAGTVGADVHDDGNGADCGDGDGAADDDNTSTLAPGNACTCFLKTRNMRQGGSQLQLIVDDKTLDVVDMELNGKSVLLERQDTSWWSDSTELMATCGLKFLYWSLLSYLLDDDELDIHNRSVFQDLLTSFVVADTTFLVQDGLRFSPDVNSKAELCPMLYANVFKAPPQHFVAVRVVDDSCWFGQPILLLSFEHCGEQHNVAYMKWLEVPLAGKVRESLPIPFSFPVHQWARAHMGLLRHRNRNVQPFSIVSIDKIMNRECLTHCGDHTTIVPVGGPVTLEKGSIYVNNIHAWISHGMQL